MKTRNTMFIIGLMLIVILLTDFGLFVAPAISYESVDQDRTMCLRDCKDQFGIDMMFRGSGGNSDWRLYFMCIDRCEKKFWKEWQKEMDQIEKD
jgi:hypothetical protein